MKNAIRSTRSKKTAATVTATLVTQHAADVANATTTVEAAIDQLPSLRRRGAATEKTIPSGIIEVSCPIVYGPVMGAYRSDVQRVLERIMEATGATDGVVFHSSRRELTKEDLDAMAAQVEDESVPLRQRGYLADLLEKLRGKKDANGR